MNIVVVILIVQYKHWCCSESPVVTLMGEIKFKSFLLLAKHRKYSLFATKTNGTLNYPFMYYPACITKIK